MTMHDLPYLELMRDIINNGVRKENRTGVDTLSVFGRQMRFDLAQGFPLLTTKKVHLKSVIHELLWFVRGETNIKYLKDNGVKIWDEWADVNGSIGPGYGFQWRSWPYWNEDSDVYDYDNDTWGRWEYIDQLAIALDKLKNRPNDRRNIVSAWNVPYLDDMGLPPCHLLFQFYVANNRLSCQMYQRSCDFFLGVPFNIASYALLTMMMAEMAGLEYGEFIWIGGDTHLYVNHTSQAVEQLSRDPRPSPTMILNYRGQGIEDWKYEDFTLTDYNPHPVIKAPVAV